MLNKQLSLFLWGLAILVTSLEVAAVPKFESVSSAYFPQITTMTGSTVSGGAMADLDHDGDLDLAIGQFGRILYYENTGNALYVNLEERYARGNPFYGPDATLPPVVDVDSGATPALVDFDKDGDLDLFVGNEQGKIFYYENKGSPQQAVFEAQANIENPFDSMDVGFFSVPTFGDIDNDGDIDAFIGEQGGTVKFYRNTGTVKSPNFIEVTGENNPLNRLYETPLSGKSAPSLIDFDQDGDLDLFIGEDNGQTRYYLNIGSIFKPEYIEQFGNSNPFSESSLLSNSIPTFGDIDADGDLDAFLRGVYYENVDKHIFSEQKFIKHTGENNPLNSFNSSIGQRPAPFFIDFDKDGNQDVIVGLLNPQSGIPFYQNVSNSMGLRFIEKIKSESPIQIQYDNRAVYQYPVYLDIDKDNDTDLFIGNINGTIQFYENITSNSSSQ
ncbi:FG-GAP repeat domain-containing protein, partial [Candidatus Venteria ishoeyi]